MSQQRLISIDLRADFGFFKKPDLNDGILLSYNMIHKPSLIGIFGAVVGLGGYQRKGEFPEYYHAFKDVPVGIEPLGHERGNYQKTSVKYTNTVGYANADGNLLVEEMMLISPAYRCYALLDLEVPEQNKLYEYLKAGKAEYIPYFGKNEYQACWLDKEGEVSFREYKFERAEPQNDFKVSSLFLKESPVKGQKVAVKLSLRSRTVNQVPTFSYFERLPVGFNEVLVQYQLMDFAFTDWLLSRESTVADLYKVGSDDGENKIIQLF